MTLCVLCMTDCVLSDDTRSYSVLFYEFCLARQLLEELTLQKG
jgi:hypothetical protein